MEVGGVACCFMKHFQASVKRPDIKSTCHYYAFSEVHISQYGMFPYSKVAPDGRRSVSLHFAGKYLNPTVRAVAMPAKTTAAIHFETCRASRCFSLRSGEINLGAASVRDAFNFHSLLICRPNEMINYTVIKACHNWFSVFIHEGPPRGGEGCMYILMHSRAGMLLSREPWALVQRRLKIAGSSA